MISDNIKVESGIQLLARLSKKKGIDGFYPHIFNEGPKPGHVIELYSDQSTNFFIEDIVSETLIPNEINGVEAKVLIFSTDGNFNLDSLNKLLRKKVFKRLQLKNSNSECNINKLENIVSTCLRNIFILELYDITQFYVTIQNIENILAKHVHISLVVFDTVTAFYWSEQKYEIKKMDLYLKNIISLIQKITKDHKVTVLYSRPEYFSSKKESLKNLGPCFEHATEDQINYRIQVVHNFNEGHYINIQTHNGIHKVDFYVTSDNIEWLHP